MTLLHPAFSFLHSRFAVPPTMHSSLLDRMSYPGPWMLYTSFFFLLYIFLPSSQKKWDLHITYLSWNLPLLHFVTFTLSVTIIMLPYTFLYILNKLIYPWFLHSFLPPLPLNKGSITASVQSSITILLFFEVRVICYNIWCTVANSTIPLCNFIFDVL